MEAEQAMHRITRLEDDAREYKKLLAEVVTDMRLLAQAMTTVQTAMAAAASQRDDIHELDKRVSNTENALWVVRLVAGAFIVSTSGIAAAVLFGN